MYASLHNRTAYSFGSALTRPEELVRFAAAQAMTAVALTDLHGLYAAVPFQQRCHEAGIKPIFGAEFQPADDIGMTLLACGLTGYGALCRLVSLHHLSERPLELRGLSEHAEDVICLVGRTPDDALLSGTLTALRKAFDGRLYLELSLHGGEDAPLARRRARLADELAVPVVATCESRCVRPDQAPILRALSSIGTLTLLDQPHPEKPLGAWHLRTPAEMQRLFARRPDALANSLAIAEQCNVTLDLTRSRFPAFGSPDGRSAMECLRELSVAGCRRRYVDEPPLRGLGGKRPTLAEALERLERELAIIEQVHYAEYFLVFHEIVQFCRSQGIATLARGSAADSLVCYALGVSHACPFRFDLPFDRFVNPERAKFSKMADIDLDLPWDRRDEVIRWVYDRWGHDRVAMIGSPHTFHARAAVGELGKVFGLPAHEVHRVTKLLPRVAAWNLPEAVGAAPEARDLPLGEEPYRTIVKMAAALEGLPRHWSMHPCGLVVSPEPLTGLVPVQRSPKGPLVAQYDMDAIEDLGFVKIDLLGQAGLSVLRDAAAEIERTGGRRVDLQRDVDYADADTWDMIARGDARGVHHIESPAMTSLIRQCNVRDIDALTIIVAIIRPGAANQGKKEAFARRYQGIEPARYVHPLLVPVLDKTYGLMVFEEHILQVAVEFAGMNLGRADVLRRALNRENQALIRELKGEFYARAQQRGRGAAEIDAVWALLEGFSGFMFNKAHSAEYAVEAFQGAWLKRRWPAHYIAAVLSNYRGFYAHSPTLPQILYVLEALRLGVGFRPPCVHRSRERFSVEYDGCSQGEHGQAWGGMAKRSAAMPGWHGQASGGMANPDVRRDAMPGWHGQAPPGEPSDSMGALVGGEPCPRHPVIRVPVSHIKGLSQTFIDRHLAEREKGPFASLTDFVERCRPGEAEALMLLDSGALDGLAPSPAGDREGAGGGPPLADRGLGTKSLSPLGSWHGLPARDFAGKTAVPDPTGTGSKQATRPLGTRNSELGTHVSTQDSGLRTGSSRPRMFWQLRRMLRRDTVLEATLWDADQPQPEQPPPVELTGPDLRRIATREMELLGFPISIDPLTYLGSDDQGRAIDWSAYVPVAQLGDHLGEHVSLCGLMVADRIERTQGGGLMKFVTLADRTGLVESYLFPDVYQRFGHLTAMHPILSATGLVEPFENRQGFTFRVEGVFPPRWATDSDLRRAETIAAETPDGAQRQGRGSTRG